MEKSSESLLSIKSVFTIRSLFSFIEEKIKLEIIRYNKNLQNINGIILFIIRELEEKK